MSADDVSMNWDACVSNRAHCLRRNKYIIKSLSPTDTHLSAALASQFSEWFEHISSGGGENVRLYQRQLV